MEGQSQNLWVFLGLHQESPMSPHKFKLFGYSAKGLSGSGWSLRCRGAHPMLQNTLCAYQSLGGCERPLQGTQPWSRHLLSSADCKLFQQCPSADLPRDPAQSGISQQQAAPGGLSPIHSFHPDPWLSLCDGMESKRRACPAISFREERNSFSTPQRSWDSSLATQLILKHR